ncbi:hypothetical protein BH24BAC1_BH24BAC1_32730 [soil metagenome]|jgi:hypothetical protein
MIFSESREALAKFFFQDRKLLEGRGKFSNKGYRKISGLISIQ